MKLSIVCSSLTNAHMTTASLSDAKQRAAPRLDAIEVLMKRQAMFQISIYPPRPGAIQAEDIQLDTFKPTMFIYLNEWSLGEMGRRATC